ncbi:protein GAMETE EXPRESSED 1-like [Miscanthus floridulus]|uniref:protein GAMETE EXPRESSED 1-like n=1 Tax=Miscanthus floridulus TaxID=154761 RepID=UPI0034598670
MARQEEEIRSNFQSILENQQEFTAMQANISAALENVLHMAILVDSQSRLIRTFFFYCCVAFLLYMSTTAEQTLRIRGHLCLGLCASVMLESGVIKLGADDDYSTQLSMVLLLRSVLFAAATVHILHSIVTYKRG